MSDEEFFMSEEELAKGTEKKEVKPKKKTGGAKRSGVLPKTMNFVLAVVLIVCAFVLGFFARGLMAPTSEEVTGLPPGHPTIRPGAQAPPLTEQQLKSGEFPSSYPAMEITEEAQETTEATSETTAP